jgi:hypothetical protein
MGALVLRRRPAERFEAAIDLDRVAVDGNGLLVALAQQIGDGDGDGRLPARGGAEDGKDLWLRLRGVAPSCSADSAEQSLVAG